MPTFANTINGNEILAKRSQCDYAGNDIQATYATKTEVAAKQDAISDLATIRSGAADGATAVQPGDLATVATTGSYDDLSDKPTIPAAQVNSDWNSNSGVSQILNKPTLSTVATTGDYDDLSNKPSIPAAQVQADWTEVDNTDPSYIQNKPTLATVATSGLYSDLSGTPTINNVPAVTSSDDNKVLKASYTGGVGSYSWEQESGGTVTDVEVDGTSVVSGGVASITMPTVDQTFDSTSADAQSGIAIAGELATINQVPASTSADSGKVLTVDASGIPGWVTGGGGSTGLFEAVYGQTTYADIVQAIADKKIVYCRVSPSGASRMAFLAYIGSSNVEFQYYRSLNSHSASNQTDEVYVYTVYSSGWTTTTRLAGIKYIAGTNMSQSYNSSDSTLTFSATMPTVDQTYDGTSTNAQSGTAVAGAIAGVNQVPASTSSDEGKVLTVDSNGDPQWATGGGGGGVTDVEVDGVSVVSGGVASITMPTVDQVYDGTSTDAQSGVAVAGAIASINQVPASTSSDSGKVLTVDAQGIPGWVTGGGGGGVQSDWTEADPTSMAYIQNKPTPKTLTAGDGIAVTESASAINVSADVSALSAAQIQALKRALGVDETVLWSGTYSGAIGSSNYITLAEDPANFDKIIITNGGGYKSSYQFDGSSNVWSFVQSYANTSSCSLYAIRYSVDHTNKKLTCLCANFFETYANGVRNWANRTEMNVGELQLTKIVGIRRIASN